MADQMSLNYVVINRNPDGTDAPTNMKCRLSANSESSAGACTNSPTSRSQLLQFQYLNPDPNHFVLETQYLLDRLDGDPDVSEDVPDTCTVVTQSYEFWKEGFDACEASDVLSCARFKPIASYQYYTDSGPDIDTVNLGQQFLFNPTQPGQTVSQSQPDVSMLMYDCEHGDAYPDCGPAGITGMYGSNPLTTETAVRVVQNGQTATATTDPNPIISTNANLSFVRSDNLHLRQASSEPTLSIAGPTANGNPGCPECVHIHWRWAQLLQRSDPLGAFVVSPRFNNFNGNAIVTPDQDVDIAVDRYNSSNTDLDPSGHLWAGSTPNTINISAGAPLAFWYSGTGHSAGGTFFSHGGFFSSLRVSIGNPTVFGLPLPIPQPVGPQELACLSVGVQCPVSSPITNNTGHTVHWVATFTDLNGSVIPNGNMNPNVGDISTASGYATIMLPPGPSLSLWQTMILNIEVTDTTTQWTTQRQAYVVQLSSLLAP